MVAATDVPLLGDSPPPHPLGPGPGQHPLPRPGHLLQEFLRLRAFAQADPLRQAIAAREPRASAASSVGGRTSRTSATVTPVDEEGPPGVTNRTTRTSVADDDEFDGAVLTMKRHMWMTDHSPQVAAHLKMCAAECGLCPRDTVHR
jgi:hypothetical protein